MTATREPAPPEAGEWAIVAASYRKTPHALGGPYQVAKLRKRGVGGWTVEPDPDGGSTFVGDARIKRVYLTRGEALLALRDIDNAVAAYDDERANLLPRYQARVAGILSI